MRTYGRVTDPKTGQKSWVVVETDANGYNDWVYLVTLCQVLQGIRGESPFYPGFGLPAVLSVVQQLFPDFFVSLTQQQFAGYFASLQISKQQATGPKGQAVPAYLVSVVTNQGAQINAYVPLPT